MGCKKHKVDGYYYKKNGKRIHVPSHLKKKPKKK